MANFHSLLRLAYKKVASIHEAKNNKNCVTIDFLLQKIECTRQLQKYDTHINICTKHNLNILCQKNDSNE